MTVTDKPKQRRGFALMTPEKRREIASLGGKAVPDEKRSYSRDRKLAEASGTVGGMASGGNFANDPARAAEAGRKGGQRAKELGYSFVAGSEKAVSAGRKGGQATPSNFKNDAAFAAAAGRKGGLKGAATRRRKRLEKTLLGKEGA